MLERGGQAGGKLDRAAQLVGAHLPDEDAVTVEQRRQLLVCRAALEEVGAQGEEEGGVALRSPRGSGERGNERPAFLDGDVRAQQLLELVYGEDQRLDSEVVELDAG